MIICMFQAAREEGLNEGIRAMFSAGLGGALMKVSSFAHIRLIINGFSYIRNN